MKDFEIKVFRAGKLFVSICVWLNDDPNLRGQYHFYPLPGYATIDGNGKKIIKFCETFPNPYRTIKL